MQIKLSIPKKFKWQAIGKLSIFTAHKNLFLRIWFTRMWRRQKHSWRKIGWRQSWTSSRTVRRRSSFRRMQDFRFHFRPLRIHLTKTFCIFTAPKNIAHFQAFLRCLAVQMTLCVQSLCLTSMQVCDGVIGMSENFSDLYLLFLVGPIFLRRD